MLPPCCGVVLAMTTISDEPDARISNLIPCIQALEEVPGELTTCSMTNGLGSVTSHQQHMQYAFEGMGFGGGGASSHGEQSMPGHQLILERSPSMTVAARATTAAVNSLHGSMRATLDMPH